MIEIIVRGIPAPQGSKTVNRYGGVRESSKAVGPWREAVRGETQRICGSTVHAFSGPVKVRIWFLLPRPKGHYGTGRNAANVRPGAPAYPAGLPDLDKLCRAVLDGLTMGGAWKDDSQVVKLEAEKLYSLHTPGCKIEISEVAG